MIALYGLTEAQVAASVRRHRPDEAQARQIVGQVYAGLWEAFVPGHGSHPTFVDWLRHRAEAPAREYPPPGRA